MGCIVVWERDFGTPKMSVNIGRNVLLQEAAAIENLAAHLDDLFAEAALWLLACKGRVITCGLGKSGHIARKASGTLSSTGTPSLFLHAAEAVHGDLGIVTQDDVVLLYTHSGETDEIVRLFPSLKDQGAKTILITGRPNSSAGRLSDLVLNTGVVDEACPNNLAPTTSTTVMLALSDALALAVMDLRAFKPDDYAKLHPGGTLGKRLLLTVRDVMRTGAEVAYVSSDETVLEAMQAIGEAGAGGACVIGDEGELLGYFSDGDLRRHFINSSEPFAATARDIMSQGVTTIEPFLMAVEALEYFQNFPKKIGEMPVVEDGKVIGLLVMKDLVRTGI
ncbi:MAG TPA: KpsF/GutQ family sugar-phosphate isomerase [Fimbriimonadaceae bacterium]